MFVATLLFTSWFKTNQQKEETEKANSEVFDRNLIFTEGGFSEIEKPIELKLENEITLSEDGLKKPWTTNSYQGKEGYPVFGTSSNDPQEENLEIERRIQNDIVGKNFSYLEYYRKSFRAKSVEEINADLFVLQQYGGIIIMPVWSQELSSKYRSLYSRNGIIYNEKHFKLFYDEVVESYQKFKNNEFSVHDSHSAIESNWFSDNVLKLRGIKGNGIRK